eukprot:Tbor_TRINITY_DN5723_c4_g1::TRINITY_DN5723_c4_g1_i3::g.20548::m.20548
MPVGILKSGGAVVYGMSLSPFSGWQHGSIDAALLGRVSTFSRVMCFTAAGWSVRSKDPLTTYFAVSNEIIMSPQEAIPRGIIKPTDCFFGVSSLVDVGNSSVTFVMKLYLSIDKDCASTAPGEIEGKAKGDFASPVNTQNVETLKLIWADSDDSTSNSHLPPELIGIPLGSSTLTIVNINKETRKSCPISPEIREDFFRSKSEELLKQWQQEGYVPKRDTRVEVDFNMILTASKAFQKAWVVEKEALVKFNSSCTTHEKVDALVAGEMDRIALSESTNITKNEDPFSKKWKDENIFIFTNIMNLRPEDFDFNSHLNMNMYMSFAMDTIRMSLYEYLDYVGTKRSLSKERSSLMCPVEVAGMDDNGEQNKDVGTFHVDHLGRFLLANNYHTLIINSIVSKNDINPMLLFHDCSAAAASPSQPQFSQSGKSIGLTLEEMVKRSRIEFVREMSDIHSRVEVTVFSHHKETGTDTMRDKCDNDLPYGRDSILLKFIIRCLPPIPAKDKKSSYAPYIAAIGEIFLGYAI